MRDEQGNLVGKWGPRAPEVQRIVEEACAALPPKDDPSFPEKQKEMYVALTKRFVDDQTHWSCVYESFKKTVLAAISLSTGKRVAHD
jgi:hypothetical protein